MVAPIVAAAAISAPHKYIVSIWVTPFCLWLGHKTNPNACYVFAEPTETVTPPYLGAAGWDGEGSGGGFLGVPAGSESGRPAEPATPTCLFTCGA